MMMESSYALQRSRWGGVMVKEEFENSRMCTEQREQLDAIGVC
jgi:hypothetical protein